MNEPSTAVEPEAPEAPEATGAAAAGQSAPPWGFRAFLVLWAGQTISLLGSATTGFALGVWVYQRTGSVTDFALISLFTALPGILLTPVAGALVDRWDRRLVLMASDAGAALGTLAIAVLLALGRLEIWHIYVAMGISSLFSGLQWPAYTAATTLLVPKRHFVRSAGLRNIGQSAANLVAPMLGGVLLTVVGIQWVIWFDLGSFAFAVLALIFIRIPPPEASAEGSSGRGSFRGELAAGWRFLRSHRGLFALVFFPTVATFFLEVVHVLAPPMVLGFASATEMGTAFTIAITGMLAGGVFMTAWGGPEHRVWGMIGAMVVCGLTIAVGASRPSLPLFTVAGFCYFVAFAVAGGCGQAIWQAKVPPDLQGRVLSLRRFLGWSGMPVAYLVAGPLADHVFEPLMVPGGALADTVVGNVLGVGEGRGVALLLLISSALLILGVAGFALNPRVRHVEQEIPDRVGD